MAKDTVGVHPDPKEILQSVDTILVIDWPGRDVPQSLALAGFHVVVRSGPGPDDYSVHEVIDGEVVVRRTGRAPERADLVYCYRPLSELPQTIATARNLQAHSIWIQSGFSSEGVKDPTGCWLGDEDLRAARNLVRSAGLTCITEPYIGAVAREIL